MTTRLTAGFVVHTLGDFYTYAYYTQQTTDYCSGGNLGIISHPMYQFYQKDFNKITLTCLYFHVVVRRWHNFKKTFDEQKYICVFIVIVNNKN